MTSSEVADEKAQRISAIQKLWIPYPDANKIIRDLKRLVNAELETRPECIAIVGDPNFGKSELLRHFHSQYEKPYDPNVDTPSLPVLLAEMPEDATPSAFVRELLRECGLPLTRHEPLDMMVDRLKVLLRELHTKLILVDEFNKGFNGTHPQQQKMLNLTRGISNRTQIPLVVAGIESIDSFIKNDPQLDERFRRIRLPAWVANENSQRLHKAFEEAFQLQNPSKLGSPAMTEIIIGLARGRLGNISRLLKHAAIEAISSGVEQITKDSLSKMVERLPARAA